jgi:hypothetical protein
VLLPSAASAQFAEKKVLTLEIARKVVAAAEAEASRNYLAGVVAVVGDSGWPILIERMAMPPVWPARKSPLARLEQPCSSRNQVRCLRLRSTTGGITAVAAQ